MIVLLWGEVHINFLVTVDALCCEEAWVSYQEAYAVMLLIRCLTFRVELSGKGEESQKGGTDL
jgi:hypothetical protein